MEHESTIERLNRLGQLSDAECLQLASEILADASMGIVVHAIKVFGRSHNVAKYLNQRRPNEAELATYEAWMAETAGALENFYLTDLIVRLRDVIAHNCQREMEPTVHGGEGADRSKEPYELIPVGTATCPRCDSHPLLLAPAGVVHVSRALPAFLICASCLYIGQIGVGAVPRMSEAGID